MSFTALLKSKCNISVKALNTEGYEKVLQWTTTLTDVPTRKDSATAASMSDGKVRENNDDDIFFFDPDVAVARGNRIVFDGDDYDVVKVNKVYGALCVHHLEVVARLTDHA